LAHPDAQWQQQQQQQQQQQSHVRVAPPDDPHRQQQQQRNDAAQSAQSEDAAPASHDNGNLNSSSSSSSSSLLPPLTQHQVLKRALSEVGAFRLPHQTNRLALLFGPHANPPVCLSFGVEVFEPRHVTPLHIHNSAHELFFVLAGKAEGVSGTEQQRTALTAGDVAVFPPGVLHGIDNPSSTEQLYCLQVGWVQVLLFTAVLAGVNTGCSCSRFAALAGNVSVHLAVSAHDGL
jgi:mannose-6-phosphate isomerase-like protein (cupin superfamily)